jgi:hypothetical protein
VLQSCEKNWAKGLDVDGSKKALVSRFQEAKMRKTANQSV